MMRWLPPARFSPHSKKGSKINLDGTGVLQFCRLEIEERKGVDGITLVLRQPRAHMLIPLSLKPVGNGRENPQTFHVPIFLSRDWERERERKMRTEKRNRYYGISGTEHIDWEPVDYNRE